MKSTTFVELNKYLDGFYCNIKYPFEYIFKLLQCFLDYPFLDYPVIFWGIFEKNVLLFLSEIHFGLCYAFLCVVKVPKINILMCKTLRAWPKKGRKIVPRRSKRLMRDFMREKWDTFIIRSFSIIRSYSLNPVSNTTG